MRWDLVDTFEILKKGVHARARKKLTGSEDFFGEHFPGKPRVPQPLLLEMIAQTGGVLLGVGCDFKKEVVLAKISGARFSRSVTPPCEFVIEAEILEEREQGGRVAGRVKLRGEKVAEAEIMLAMIDGLEKGKKQIIFNEGFLKHYDIYNVVKKSENIN